MNDDYRQQWRDETEPVFIPGEPQHEPDGTLSAGAILIYVLCAVTAAVGIAGLVNLGHPAFWVVIAAAVVGFGINAWLSHIA